MTSLVTFCGFMLGSVGVYSMIIFPSTTDGLPYNILSLVWLHSTVYKICAKHSNLENKNNTLPRIRQRLSKWHFDFCRHQKQFCNNTPFRCMFSFPIMLIHCMGVKFHLTSMYIWIKIELFNGIYKIAPTTA